VDIVNYLQAHNLYFLVYVFFTLGMLVEGLLFALTVMFLIITGIVQPVPAIASIAIGAMLEQGLFYYVGTRLTNFPRISKWANRIAQRFDNHITKRTVHTLLISKFVYGVHRAILMRSGMLRIPRKQFFRASFLSTVFWLIIIGGLSYFFSAYLVKFAKYYTYVDLLPFALVIGFLLLERLAGRFLKRWL
jgi:membrane protein DedA with SNARE-associated domain